MPFRSKTPQMPDNRQYALKRTESVKRKMLNDKSFHAEYAGFMSKLISAGYARRAAPIDDGGSC